MASAVKIDKDEEGIKKLQTVGFKNMGGDFPENAALREELEDMSQKELVKLALDMGKNQLRHHNYNTAAINERKGHFKSALTDLQKSIDEKTKKAKKYKSFGSDPVRTIKALEKAIGEEKKEIAKLEKEVQKFEEKKKAEDVQLAQAREQIDKNLVKKTYKFLEKDSHPHLVTVLETFVAQLRAKDRSSKEDVELYLRKYDGLSTSMSKLDTRDIPGEYEKVYVKNLDSVKAHFKEGGENEIYIPYFDFAHFTNRLLALTTEEKQIEAKIHALEEGIKEKEREIDEIETFRKDVDEVIDYQNQVDEEVKQFNLLQEHYNLLNLRAKKLGKCSKFFQKYYFREVKDKKRLRSTKWEKIDTMDDLDHVDDIEDKLDEMDYERAIEKVSKDDKDDNPLGDQHLRAKTLAKRKTVYKEEEKKAAKKSEAPAKVDDVKVKLEDKKVSDKSKPADKAVVAKKDKSGDSEDESAASSEEDSGDSEGNSSGSGSGSGDDQSASYSDE